MELAEHGEFYKDVTGNTWTDPDGLRWQWSETTKEWMTEAKFAQQNEVEEEVVQEAVVEAPKRKRGRPRKEETVQRTVEAAAKDAIFELFVAGAKVNITETLQNAVNEGVMDLTDYLDKIQAEILNYESKKIHIITPRGTKEFVGTRHMRFEQLLTVVSAGLSAMIVGPAGSGKTYASEQVADALDLPFYAISVGAQTSKSDLFGYMDGGGTYRSTMFRQAYEHGGVFLMDEIDAGNANVLVMLNSALAGSSAAFPDKQDMVKKHENFRFISTANTFGTGASRQYVGRNQIDAATLDRFVTIDWPVDEALEAMTIKDYTHGPRWHGVVKRVRQLVDSNKWRVVVSPRATMKGAMLLESGLDFAQVLEMTLLSTATEDQRPQITNAAKGAW